ncbi:uncharacterized protein I206_103068 [Kwoniella pini CBS 10737]|uniref:Uncharacterized protein n=1 Tax=Kwoniella pini CBS 10737 TaxID=1296096 RepID=A0A1B9IAJ1_9TREE|nr:uncharacterized protein I206_01928 [Kwoniella pini CBS 10737]OCF52635.1 hypothetical protein I206_01928 [Kwoniella pini CBS 10737]
MSFNPLRLRISLQRPTQSIKIIKSPFQLRSFRNSSRNSTSTHTSTTSHSNHTHNHQHINSQSTTTTIPPPNKNGKKTSPHLVWYREIVPAMIPIFLISTTLFLSLSLIRLHLSHSKLLIESNEKIQELEIKLTKLKFEQKKQILREKKERERILPLIVERVLQRVGVVNVEEEEKEEGIYEKNEIQNELPRLL